VSFTFDDGRESQLTNLAPMLDSMPEVKVTFFLSGITPQQRSHQIQGFAELICKGHEAGNHTFDHPYLTQLTKEADLKRQILDYAENLESIFGDVRCAISSFATPYCANSETVQGYIGKRHFINRDCGWGGCYRWSTEPTWLSIMSKAWNRNETTVEDMERIIDSAMECSADKSSAAENSAEKNSAADTREGGWAILLNHGVEEDSDEYNIDPRDMKAILAHACKSEIWAAPFGTVGAYYRAHFTLDETPATKTDKGYSMEWELPHPHMPKNIPLKVRLKPLWATQALGSSRDVVILQGDKIIHPDETGTYTIEFTKQSLLIKLF